MQLWVAPPVIPLAVGQGQPATVHHQVTLSRPQFTNNDGSFGRVYGYRNCSVVDKTNVWDMHALKKAGVTNKPNPFGPSNPFVCLDPYWYPSMYVEMGLSDQKMVTEGLRSALGDFFRAQLSAERVQLEHKDKHPNDKLPHPIYKVSIDSVIGTANALGTIALANGSDPERCNDLFAAILDPLGRMLGRMKVTVRLPSAESSETPPWYYRRIHEPKTSSDKRERDDDD